jgi:hypothetical protein
MATSFSNETSMASLVEFSSDSLHSGSSTLQETHSYSSKSGNPFTRSDNVTTNQSPKQSTIAASNSSS